MPPTALYFLPPNPSEPPSTTLTTHLTALYNPTPLPPWTLTHRLFRETPLPNNSSHIDKSKPPPPQRYLQILTLSHHAPRTYVAITTTTTPAPSQTRAGTPASSEAGNTTTGNDPATIISIPTIPSTDDLTQLILSKFGPLWQQRQVLGVVNGAAFEIGDFRVRIGEVRLAGGGGGGGQMMGKGAVCEVEWVGGEGEDRGEDDWEGAGAVIAGFWEGLGVKGGRRVFEVAGVGEGDGCVRQWCEGLRVRG